MSWSGNGRYWGPRPDGPSLAAASGWWDSRAQFVYTRSSSWPQTFPDLPVSGAVVRINPNKPFSVYDAEAGGALAAVGDLIGRVEDASGNGHHAFNSDSATRPTLASPAWANGLLGVNFTGTKRLENWSMPALGTGGYTVFTVLSCNSTSPGASTIAQLGRGISSSANGSNNRALLWNSTPSGWRSAPARVGGTFLTTTDPALGANVMYLFTGRRNSNTFSHWINGAATTPASASVSMDIIGGFALGMVRGTGGWEQPWPGYVFEHIVYASALTDQERQDVENQLMAYWGIV